MKDLEIKLQMLDIAVQYDDLAKLAELESIALKFIIRRPPSPGGSLKGGAGSGHHHFY
jgi:hypothetical protein